MSTNLSTIDIKILEILQSDCSTSYEQMAELVGRSPTACLRRTKSLEQRGFIKSREAVLDSEALGFEVTAIFSIKLAQDVFDLDKKLLEVTNNTPEILQCYIVAAGADFMFIAKFKSTQEYKDFVFNIINVFADLHVREYDSFIVVREICDHRRLPLKE